ncbi:hypothetical protein EIG77_08935 [Avibacterium paragallinarum]|nr:hypothetical protein EIG77_08935 [Avibacterium paragallinarum]
MLYAKRKSSNIYGKVLDLRNYKDENFLILAFPISFVTTSNKKGILICPQKVRLYSNFIQGLSSVFHRA